MLLFIKIQTFKISSADSTPSGFPRIVQSPVYAEVTSGDDGSFECNATGNPHPIITWLKESKPLDLSNPRISIPKPGTVKITNVQASDAGRYACVATNSLGMVYSRVATLVYKGLCQNKVKYFLIMLVEHCQKGHELTIGSCFSVHHRVMEHAGSLESTKEA